jgi:hypothetical protein
MKTGAAVVDRRRFFHALGAGAAVTIVARSATRAMADTETADEKRKARYQESEHVKEFYRVNRYPG